MALHFFWMTLNLSCSWQIVLRAQPLYGNLKLNYPDLYWDHCGLIWFHKTTQSHIAPYITSRLIREQLTPRRIFLRNRWSPFGILFLLLKLQRKKFLAALLFGFLFIFVCPLCWSNAWVPCDTPTLQQISLKPYVRHCAASFKVNSNFFALATRPPQHSQPVKPSPLSDGKN